MLYLAVREGVAKPSQAWRAYQRLCSGTNPMMILPGWVPNDDRRKRRFMAQAEPLYSEFVKSQRQSS